MSDEEKTKALRYAYRILNIRPRTFFEMEQKLKKRDLSKETTKAVIKELKEQELLDDKKFAELWTKEKIQWHPSGHLLILKQLMERGVRREIIEETLEKLLPLSKEIKLAKEVLKKKKETLKRENLSPNKLYQKLAMFLKGKGFTGEVIGEVLEKE